jgi:hypothetical protein
MIPADEFKQIYYYKSELQLSLYHKFVLTCSISSYRYQNYKTLKVVGFIKSKNLNIKTYNI